MAKTKALISFAVTAKLICAFGFAYADCWFSHEVAHILQPPLTCNQVHFFFFSHIHNHLCLANSISQNFIFREKACLLKICALDYLNLQTYSKMFEC